MTAESRPLDAVARRGPATAERLVGLGSVFGKSIRDGWRAAVLLGLFGGVLMLAGGAALVAEWPDRASRLGLTTMFGLLPPIVRGLLGDPVALDTMGGFISWRFGNIAPVLLGIWSVLALSGTLAGEARRGSLDLVVTTPVSRRAVAAQKAAGHAALVGVVVLLASILTWLAGVLFGTIPEDRFAYANSLAAWLLIGLLMLASGAVAFAAATVVGRARGAAVGLVVLFAGYLVVSYRSLAPAFATFEPLSWYAWTAGHRPLAGTWDWPPVLLLAGVTVALFAVGVWLFERRDVGATVGAGRFALPRLPAGTAGPFARQLSDRIGDAVGWGIGIGAYGMLIAGSADDFIAVLDQIPGITEMVERFYPGIDIRQPSALLELAFVAFGSLLIGLAAAGFVAGVASDETGRRLDLVLSNPLARAAWFVRTCLAAVAAAAITALVASVLISAVVAGTGGDPVGPFVGSAVLALYASAFIGIGAALIGLGLPRIAAVVTAVVSILSYLLSALGNALGLPDWLIGLSLSEHIGRPMSGVFDPVGLVVMAALAVGGVAVGAWGLTRRDLRG